MNQISHRALIDLMSFGTEELSSADATRLMQIVAECPECEGEWLLLRRTISTLSIAGELPVAESKSHEMWLVCLGHAKTHHYAHSGNGNGNGHRRHEA
ncbi:hypothetical protein IAD21_03995 [Abditibacteriota bacterium]|nr:hypothetical protein IAD21_03995 [Abditibacteriota bacterium]